MKNEHKPINCYADWIKSELSLAESSELYNNDGNVLKALHNIIDDEELMSNSDISNFLLRVSRDLNDIAKFDTIVPVTEDDEFEYVETDDDCAKIYRCVRSPYIYKVETEDETYCLDKDNIECIRPLENIPFYNGFVIKYAMSILKQRFTFPYVRSNRKTQIIVNEFLYDIDNGDFDTIKIIAIRNPDGTVTKVNKMFKEYDIAPNESTFIEIGYFEYWWRKLISKLFTEKQYIRNLSHGDIHAEE